MLDAADVLVHRHPVIVAAVDHGGAVRARIAHVVPARIDEGIHRVGLAARRLAARRARALQEARVLGERVAAAVWHQVFGQTHRQVLFRHRHHAAAVAMDQRDRRAPVALARDTPVAQAPGGFLLAQALGGQVGGDGVHGLPIVQAVVLAAVDQHAVLLVGIPLLPSFGAERLALHVDDLLDGQAVLVGEGEVALVVRGHAHHGAVAVGHQHVVADPHGHGLAGERMRDGQAGRHALLFHGRHVGFHHAAMLAFVDERGKRGIALRGMRGDRVLGGHGAEGHAHDGVGARGEDVQLAVADHLAVIAGNAVREGEAHTLALADPVLLHQLDALGPAQRVQVGQQLLRIVGDAQVVHRDLALFHHRARAPAAPVDHLLVGEHGLVDRVPVDGAGLAVGDALLEHLQEQPLVPLVVVGTAGRHLARPVDRQAHRLHLLLHVSDVVVGPGGRRHAVVQRGVLGRHAEGVPAHRHQHVVPLHAQLTRHHVVDGVVAHVAHVQLARRVRQHRTGVELRLVRAVGGARVFGHAVGILCLPVLLRLLFDLGRGIFVLHDDVARRRPRGDGGRDASARSRD